MLFKKLYQSKKRGSRARLGEIVTAHGKIKTPSFVAVGTKGTVKSILPSLLKEIGTQVAFVNTYHLVTHPGVEVIEKAGGIHQYASLNLPLMSDSGGFQVFSLASPKRQFAAAGRIKKTNINEEKQPALIKISDDGVKFRSVFDGKFWSLPQRNQLSIKKKLGLI